MIGQSEKSGIEIESEYQLTGHPVFDFPDMRIEYIGLFQEVPDPGLKVWGFRVKIFMI